MEFVDIAIAFFTTHRHYIPEGWIDVTMFDEVGYISGIASGERKIGAKDLNIEVRSPVPPKVLVYLARRDPSLLEKVPENQSAKEFLQEFEKSCLTNALPKKFTDPVPGLELLFD